MKKLEGLSRSQILAFRKMAGDEENSSIYLKNGIKEPHTIKVDGESRVIIGKTWYKIYQIGWNAGYKS